MDFGGAALAKLLTAKTEKEKAKARKEFKKGQKRFEKQVGKSGGEVVWGPSILDAIDPPKRKR